MTLNEKIEKFKSFDEIKGLSFVTFPMRCFLPCEPGVYFILINDSIIYIGCSTYLHQRFVSYAKASKIFSIYKDLMKIYYLPFGNPKEIQEARVLERLLITHYCPALNKKHVENVSNNRIRLVGVTKEIENENIQEVAK